MRAQRLILPGYHRRRGHVMRQTPPVCSPRRFRSWGGTDFQQAVSVRATIARGSIWGHLQLLVMPSSTPSRSGAGQFFPSDNIIQAALCGYQSLRLNGVDLRTLKATSRNVRQG